MEKMIQVLCDNEAEAFKGLQALQQLDLSKDISLGETYVLTKDKNGRISIRSAKDKNEGYSTISGGLLGGLIGLIAGPLGLIVGVAGGMLVGSAGETLHAEDMSDYLDQVAANIPDGSSVIIAHLWEDWETPVDESLERYSKEIRRFNINEEIYAPAKTELEKVDEDIKEAEIRFLEADGATKTEWNKTLKDLRSKREALQKKLETQSDYQERQYQEWVKNYEGSDTYDEAKRNRLENRIRAHKAMLEQFKKSR